jgi:hypothetical protein
MTSPTTIPVPHKTNFSRHMNRFFVALLLCAPLLADDQPFDDTLDLVPTYFSADATYLFAEHDHVRAMYNFSDTKDCEHFATSVRGVCVKGQAARQIMAKL